MKLSINRDAMLEAATGLTRYRVNHIEDLYNAPNTRKISKAFTDAQAVFIENQKKVALLVNLIAHKAYEYTPVKTGYLRKSMFVRFDGMGADIGYTAKYATYVHEIAMYEHESPTQYKFLEDAAFEVMNEVYSRLKIKVPIYIEYSPLVLHINTPLAKGKSLYTQKAIVQRAENEINWDEKYSYVVSQMALYETYKDMPEPLQILWDYLKYWYGRKGGKDAKQLLKYWEQRGSLNDIVKLRFAGEEEY